MALTEEGDILGSYRAHFHRRHTSLQSVDIVNALAICNRITLSRNVCRMLLRHTLIVLLQYAG
jgi:hypothetical protein